MILALFALSAFCLAFVGLIDCVAFRREQVAEKAAEEAEEQGLQAARARVAGEARLLRQEVAQFQARIEDLK